MTPMAPQRSVTASRPCSGVAASHAVALILITCAVACATACAPPASRGDLQADNPASRLYAIHRAGSTGDTSAIPALVESLDHDDPAVRMMAIEALHRLTGTRLDYNPYADLTQRRAAADTWEAAVREGRFDPGRDSPPREAQITHTQP
jgi:HEAT repeat protein